MHPWKNVKLKGSEMTRNTSKTINTDVNFIVFTRLCFLFF